MLWVSNLLHQHSEATLLLLDIKKAYNTVSHAWLQEVLHTGGFSPNLVNIIITLNTGTTQLLVNNILSRPIPLWSGVKQGDSLSPTLFNLCFYPMLTKLHKENILH